MHHNGFLILEQRKTYTPSLKGTFANRKAFLLHLLHMFGKLKLLQFNIVVP